jgi:AraC-like DNA-binding protein
VKSKQQRGDFQLELKEGGSLARRRTQLLADGAYLFEDELQLTGSLSARVIACSAWLLELYDLQSGDIFFQSGGRQIRPRTQRFGVLYSPFSIIEPGFNDVRGRLIGIAAMEPLPAEFAASPRVFETSANEPPSGVAQVLEILRSGINPQPVPMNPKPSGLSLQAKRLIDQNYLVYPSIGRVAAALGVTHSHLSRQFKHDFTMSPSRYLRQLRVADAPLRLARGEEIIEVSHEVGYNDLSRFYKQFRETTKTSPGACKELMRPTPRPRTPEK